MMAEQREEELRSALAERILLLDGATGTYLQQAELSEADFGGAEFEGCNEQLTLSRPDVVLGMHRAYLEAGADILLTNTFGATSLVLADYGLEAKTHQINRRAAELAREAAAEFNTPEQPRFVAGSMGPTTKAISVTGGITFERLVREFHDQAAGLIEGGADYLLLETCPDTRNIKAGLVGIELLSRELGRTLPVAVSVTIEASGTMLAGQGVEALHASLAHRDLLYLGLNCATGPAFMTDHLRSLSAVARCPVSVMPNAGLPDEEGNYLETPEMMSAVLERFVAEGWVNLLGGCCGTGAEHVRAFVRVVRGGAPRPIPAYRRSFVSGIDFLEITEENRPVLVGERANAVGSRAFRRLISEEKTEEATEIVRRQVKGGAQVIDINLANPDRDELEDMTAFLDKVVNKVRVPLMIDSTDSAVIEAALPYCQGKSIINSINLEDGEERFAEVAPLARRYGAALVVGTIDEDPEQGMALTRQRKLEVAQRSHRLLTEKYGVPPEDLIFDPLVFPCATGERQYLGSAEETIQAIPLIKEALPFCKTVLGVSNVSFGLPPAGREVLNAVFLQHAVRAGLDLAIVNTEKLQRFASLPEEEIRLAEELLFNSGVKEVAAFADFYRERRPPPRMAGRSRLPLPERLAGYIIEGSKDGLVEDLEEALKSMRPLKIVNGPLMAGMAEVGRLFNANKMIVAEVLQSAEAMKAAVTHLEPRMEKSESAHLGTMLLATVKGDVHDIGKNLVDIVFSNNGFKVVNLGIKIPPEKLIAASAEHKPDLIGLSGLLVKSAQQMVTTAQDLRAAGVNAPILVGGAALSRNFTLKRIGPAYGGLVAYAKDVMSGLALANRIIQPDERSSLEAELAEAQQEAAKADGAKPRSPRAAPPAAVRSREIKIDLPLPVQPDLERHVLTELNLDEVWSYLSPQMLYGKHMGLRGNARRLLEEQEPKALELEAIFDDLKGSCRGGWMHARACWRFYRAVGEGNRLILLEPAGEKAVESFEFPRQPRPDGLALPDFVLPPNGERTDTVCLFVTTAGEGIGARAEELKEAGEYVKSHALHALALESAEAAAEWLHAKIRAMWGWPDPPELTPTQRLQAKYRGKRFSFGYPACPNLEDQGKLFDLLEPGAIGVRLTEGCMMEPEASVSAMVFHHPGATYFSVGQSGGGG